MGRKGSPGGLGHCLTYQTHGNQATGGFGNHIFGFRGDPCPCVRPNLDLVSQPQLFLHIWSGPLGETCREKSGGGFCPIRIPVGWEHEDTALGEPLWLDPAGH